MRRRTLASIRREVRARWPEILRAAGTIPVALPKTPKLLGSSVKVRKGPRQYVSKVVYLAPDREAMHPGDRRTLCPMASAACSLACLGHETGLLITSTSKRARLWKTGLFLGDRALFRELLDAEARAFERATVRQGKTPVIRVDGSSDTGEGERAARRHEGSAVRWYDYTKAAARVRPGRILPKGYSLTLSYSGENIGAVVEAMGRGVNVAVCFDTPKGHPLPATWRGVPVIDGDADDLRFLDPAGVVVGLRFKAARSFADALKRANAGGFVVAAGVELDLAA